MAMTIGGVVLLKHIASFVVLLERIVDHVVSQLFVDLASFLLVRAGCGSVLVAQRTQAEVAHVNPYRASPIIVALTE